MSDLVSLLGLLAPFFGLIALGFLSGRLSRLPPSGLAWMQFFLVYLALPSLFFRLISDKPIAALAQWGFIGATTAATALAFAASLAIGRWSSRRWPEAVICGVSGSYANIGYMGPPLVVSLLGEAGSAPVALIFVFDTLFLFTIVPALMGLGPGEEARSPGEVLLGVLRRVATHPFLLATAAGLLASVFQWTPPAPIGRMIEWLSGASAPCALFILGVTLALRPAGRIAGSVAALAAVKLGLHPLAAYLLVSAVPSADPVWAEAAVIMAALPPALNVFVLSAQYRAAGEQASASVLIGTLASVLTLTALLWLLRTGTMPPLLFRS